MRRLKKQFLMALLTMLCMMPWTTVLAQSKVLPDPTRPPVSANQEAAGDSSAETPQTVNQARLMAVFIKPAGRSAVINNDTVVEGQTWNGMQVLKIHPRRVVLKSESGTQELVLNDIIIKRDAQNEF
jgi:hypothetical protein